MQLDTQSMLSRNTVVLHWIVAIIMIALLATGIYMEETDARALYPWHKSFGVLIFAFVVLRVLWRIKNGWPTPIRDYTNFEKRLSRVVQYLLIIGTVLMPLSGFIMSAMGGHGVAMFGIELVARNPNPADPEKVLALNAGVAKFAHSMHGLGGKIILISVILHLAGALKHHIIDKDGTLRRMLGTKV